MLYLFIVYPCPIRTEVVIYNDVAIHPLLHGGVVRGARWCVVYVCVGAAPWPIKKSCCRQISKFRSALWISHLIQCSNITEGNEWHKFTIGDRARFLTFSLVNNVSLYKNIIFWLKQINNNVIICVFREQSMFQDFPVDEFRQYPESIRSKYYP